MPIRWRDDGDSRLDLVSGNIRNVIDIFRIRSSRTQYLRDLAASRARTESHS